MSKLPPKNPRGGDDERASPRWRCNVTASLRIPGLFELPVTITNIAMGGARLTAALLSPALGFRAGIEFEATREALTSRVSKLRVPLEAGEQDVECEVIRCYEPTGLEQQKFQMTLRFVPHAPPELLSALGVDLQDPGDY